jgi:tryptophanyl-tRNA synthetase
VSPLGLFDYPVLQAADILLYQADRVPVGEDQQQHLELTHDLAERFNRRFGPTFKVPQAMIPPVGARIMDLQDPKKKMSKSSESLQGTIRLADSSAAIRAKIRTAVTDSGCELKASADKPAISNLLTIYSIASGMCISDVEGSFVGKGYAQFKDALADVLVEYLRPVQKRYEQVTSEPDKIVRVLRHGAERARAIAARTLATVYDRVGLLPR